MCTRTVCIGNGLILPPFPLLTCPMTATSRRMSSLGGSLHSKDKEEISTINEWTLHCKKYIKGNDFTKSLQFVRVQKFSLLLIGSPWNLNSVACVRLYLLGGQLKRRIAIQALNGAIDFFLSWRLNVSTNHEDWFAQSNSESNPNFVKNVACIQN